MGNSVDRKPVFSTPSSGVSVQRAFPIRGAHFVFDWYFTKFRGAQKMSGEMLVISFVREVNHVIMAATLDRRQNQQIPLQTLQIICSFTHVMASVSDSKNTALACI